MRRESTNSFSGGLISDLNPITTPPSVLTDALNATMLTFDGNELVLQNDMGNITLTDPNDSEKFVRLTPGFIPLGVKEYAGIMYIISHNPTTLETEIGSFPGPDFIDSNSYTENSTVPTEIVVANATETDTSKLGIVYPITVSKVKPGDYFVVTLPSLEGLTTLTDLTGRKTYRVRLVNIDSNNRDVTDKFLSEQKYLSAPTVLGGTQYNQWFLPKAFAAGTNLENYINYSGNLSKVYPFNLKSGRLGVKFELEDIDLFRISVNTTGAYMPTLTTVINTATPIYKLTFDKFDVQEPSDFKVEKIVFEYKLYDNVTGEDVTPDPATITKVLTTDFTKTAGTTAIISSIIPEDPNGLFQLILGTKNVTIDYTITPWSSSTYDRPFTNHVIHNRLDLSKDPLFWESSAMYQFKDEYTYTQAIDSAVSGNITLDLDVADKDIDKYYSPFSPLIQVHENKSKILKNLRWFRANSEVVLNINIDNWIQVNVAGASNTGKTNLNASANISGTSLWSDSAITEIDNILGGERDQHRGITQANYVFQSNFNDIQLTQRNSYSFEVGGTGDLSWYDGYLTMTAFSLTLSSLTDFTIKPVLGKYKSVQGNTIPVSTFGNVTATEAVVNYGDEYFPTNSETAWTTTVESGGAVNIFAPDATSFNKTLGGYNITRFFQADPPGGALKNGITKIIPELVTGQHYILNFYARSAYLNTIQVGIENIGLQSITLTNKWKLYSIPFKKVANTEDKLAFYTNGVFVSSMVAFVDLGNVSIKPKLIQSMDAELYQDVHVYEEDVNIITDDSSVVLSRNRGVYLPYPHCNILDTTYSLSTNGTFNGINTVTFTPEDTDAPQTFTIRE